MARSKSLTLLLVALITYWFGPTVVSHMRRTFDPYTFNDDARIMIWPFLREADGALFPRDPFADYYHAGLPEGYRALYRGLGHLGVVVTASEVIPYFLMAVTLGLMTVTAHRLGGKPGAFLCATLLLGSFSVWDRLGGGLPRAFAFPLVALGAYALVFARYRLLAGAAIAGAAFYPVVAALLGLSFFFLLVLPPRLRACCEHTSLYRRASYVAVTLGIIAALLVPTMVRLRPYGAAIDATMLTRYPEAGPGGRLGPEQQPPFPPWYRAVGFHAKQGLLGTGEPIGGQLTRSLRATESRTNLLVTAVVVMAVASLGVRAYRRRALDAEVVRLLSLFAALVLGYVAASLVTPKLFLPERYAQFAAPILAILLLCAGLGASPTREAGSARASSSTKFGQRLLCWSHALGLPRWLMVGIAILLLAGRGTSWVGIEVWIAPEERPLYGAIAELPKDSVIAGWPLGPLENIPYLSRRRVLTNYQLEIPFHVGFTEMLRLRINALFAAYFASDLAPIAKLYSDYQVTHLLVDEKICSSAELHYYRPYDRVSVEASKAENRCSQLRKLARDPKTGRKVGDYYLVDLAKIPFMSADSSAVFR